MTFRSRSWLSTALFFLVYSSWVSGQEGLNDTLNWPVARLPIYSFQEGYRIGTLEQHTTPAWVSGIPPNTAALSSSPTHNGVLLVDKQLNADNESVFHHIVRRLEVSQEEESPQALLEVSYFPEWEKVAWHTLVLHRKGRILDRLGEAVFHQVSTTPGLPEHSVARRVSLVPFLENLKEGDILEYSYTIRGHKPALGNRTTDTFPLQYPYWVGRVYYRLVGDLEGRIFAAASDPAFKPDQTRLSDKQVEWVWGRQDVEGYVTDSETPSWHHKAPLIQVSEFTDWTDVAIWGHALFALPKESASEVTQLAQTIQQQNSTPLESLKASLRYVQESINQPNNLKAIPLHEPADPALVLQRGWGDHLDKARLLFALLKELSIEAQPALTSSWLRQNLAAWHPSPQGFDHAILQVHIGPNTYWVDPTIQSQGDDLELSRCCQHQLALVLSPQTRNLSSIHSNSSKPQLDLTSTYVTSPDTLKTELLVTTTLRGQEADEMRDRLAHGEPSAVLKDFEDTYQQLYGAIETSTGTINDKRDLGEIVFQEHYLLSNPFEVTAGPKTKTLCTPALSILSSLPHMPEGPRESPLALDYPNNVREIISVVTKGKTFHEESWDREWRNDAFTLKAKQTALNDTLTLSLELFTHEDHIDVEDIEEVRHTIEEVRKWLFHHVTITHHPLTSRWQGLISVGICCILAAVSVLHLRQRRSHRKP